MGPRQLGKRPANKCCRPDPTGVLRGTHSPPSQHSNGQARAGDYGGFERQGGLPVPLTPPAKRAVSDPGALSSVAVPGSGRRTVTATTRSSRGNGNSRCPPFPTALTGREIHAKFAYFRGRWRLAYGFMDFCCAAGRELCHGTELPA